ncbi:MAG: RecX family transcriptional regulator [Pseudomonadota bacterium]
MTADKQQSHRRERQTRQPRKVTAERLRRIGLAYLERYEASEAGFRAVLSRRVAKAAKAHEQDPSSFDGLIDEQVAWAKQAGLIDNTRFAANQVRQQRDRGASGRSIEARLRSKGLEASTIQAALADDRRDDASAANRYAERRRLGPYRLRDRAERRDRDVAAMCRAGFSFDLARSVIDDAQEDGTGGDGV